MFLKNPDLVEKMMRTEMDAERMNLERERMSGRSRISYAPPHLTVYGNMKELTQVQLGGTYPGSNGNFSNPGNGPSHEGNKHLLKYDTTSSNFWNLEQV